MKRTIVFTAILFMSLNANALIIMSISPGLDEAEYRELYQPIADELSEVIQEEVRLDYSGDWLTFSKRMRRGDFDLVIDGPHFIAWRLRPINLGHRGLAQLAGSESYSLVTSRDSERQRLEDFNNVEICSRNSPAIGTVYFLSRFTNPVLQPRIIQRESGEASLEAMVDGRCEAAIIRSDRISQSQGFRVVAKSPNFPKPGITIRSNMPSSVQDLIRDYFVGNEEAAQKLSRNWEFEEDAAIEPFEVSRFETVDLLTAKIWGW